ncbi:MAG TPA: L-threonylcarbamoyladenylate synthase [Nitrospira sp.]
MATLEPYAESDISRLGQTVRSVLIGRGVVGLPTETFYGLGVNPFDEIAVERLLRIKGRADDKALLVLVGDRTQIPLLAGTISPIAALLMDAFWPGALTILVPALPTLPQKLTAKSGVVGIRLSSCVPLIQLLQITGPVTGTSANRAGDRPARTAQEVAREFGPDVDVVIDAGQTPGGLPSSVVDAQDPVRLIREGAISRQMIQNVLQTQGIPLM